MNINIRSSKWQLKSCGAGMGGQMELRNKATGETRYFPRNAFPSVAEMGAAHENGFNRDMAAIWEGGA